MKGLRRLIICGVVIGIFAAVLGFRAFMSSMMMKAMTSGGAPPVVVTAMDVTELPWQPRLKAIGNLRAVKGVDVTTEVAGIVESLHFASGDEVKADNVLVKLNDKTDVAQLQAMEAIAVLAETVAERDKKQFEVNAISKATLDADLADLKSKRAQVAQQAAVVARKTIRAPFGGKLGINMVNIGQYLNPGDKIVTLQALDQIFVDFYLPQQDVARLAIGQAVTIMIDAYPGRVFSGEIVAIDPKVEKDTRNIQIEALVANPKHELLPGMFASVEVDAGALERYITLPQTAVTYNPYGETVYLVEKGEPGPEGKPVLKVKQVFVTTGETRGDQVAIKSGIAKGAMVVTSGQLKLRNGSSVIINNSVQPSNDQEPKPVE